MKLVGNKKDREGNENYLETTDLSSIPPIIKDLSIYRVNEKNLEKTSIKSKIIFDFDEEKELIYLKGTLDPIINGITDFKKYLKNNAEFIDEAADAYYEDKEFKDIDSIKNLLKDLNVEISNKFLDLDYLINGNCINTIYVKQDNNIVGIIDEYSLNLDNYIISVELGNLITIVPIENIDFLNCNFQIVFKDKIIECDIQNFRKFTSSNLHILEFELTGYEIKDENKFIKRKNEFLDREDWRIDRIQILNKNFSNQEDSFEDLEDLFD